MHIVIDARLIETSTGRYMQRLVLNLHEIADPGMRFTLLVPSQYVLVWQQKLPRFSVVAADQKPYSLSEQFSFYFLLLSLKPDLVHFTMPQQPLLFRKPAVTTIHDLILVQYDNIDNTHPLVYKFKKSVFIYLIRSVVRRAEHIIAPTEYTKNDIVSFMGGHYSNKISVTLESSDTINVAPEPIQIIDGKKFLVFVGNAFPYKNVKRIILAFREIKKSHPDIHLALAGKREFFYEQLEKFVHSSGIPDVHFLGFISDGQKKWAYNKAEAFITASLAEGFCMPVVEAMQEGCPLISSSASCLPEVAGNGALYFDPHSTESLVQAVNNVLDNDDLRNDLISRGHERVKRFSWRRMTEQTHDIYREVISRTSIKS